MKRFLFIALTQIFLFTCAYANDETIFALTNNGEQTASQLGYIDPCTNAYFEVKYNIPSGYVGVSEFDWYANGNLVKTVTGTNPDFTNHIVITGNQFYVTCKVTYFNSSGQHTSMNSNAFVVQVKSIGFYIQQTGSAYVNCPSPITFSTSGFTQSDLNFVPAAGSYSQTWQLPTDFSYTFPTSGSSIGVTANEINTETISTTLLLNACPYATTASLHVQPFTTAPAWSASNTPTACNGTTTSSYSVDPVCGATSYTFTLQGPGTSEFTGNNSRTITTTDPNVSISFQQNNSYQLTVTPTANYPNTTVQGQPFTINYGLPVITQSYYTTSPDDLPVGMVRKQAGTNTVCFTRPLTAVNAVVTLGNTNDIKLDKAFRINLPRLVPNRYRNKSYFQGT
ncbi:hypothetical protein ACQ86N_32305 [Puia sp. P3]|uniref:hypothetical protein n=1 Tax=Puia sp. P3 TaxID=3423952 RepID=UPI003D6681E8